MNKLRHCQYCGKTFTTTRKDTQTCSSSCRTMMSRERQRINKTTIHIEQQVQQVAERLNCNGLTAFTRDRLEQLVHLITKFLDT